MLFLTPRLYASPECQASLQVSRLIEQVTSVALFDLSYQLMNLKATETNVVLGGTERGLHLKIPRLFVEFAEKESSILK